MDPVSATLMGKALGALGRAFQLGAAALNYKARQKATLHNEEVKAIEAFVEASAKIGGAFSAGNGASTGPLVALHMATVARAFGAACSLHWAGNKCMAPGLQKSSWLKRCFLSKEEAARGKDIESRLRMALDAVAHAGGGTIEKTFTLMSAMVDEPLSTPFYHALWASFTNPLLEDGEQARLLELEDPSARLEFERLFRLTYAEATSAPGGADLARGILEIEKDRPRLLREIIVRWVSTWKRRHVFGDAETPGVPNMPLDEIYVEPDGVYEEQRGGSKPKHREPIRALIRSFLDDHKIVIVRGDFGQGKSLTARTLACEWAESYVTDKETRSSELWYPIFIKCGEDFPNHEPFLQPVVRRALQRQARALKIDLPLEDEALVSPTGSARFLYLIDGFDEVALTQSEVDEFFRNLDQSMSGTRKAIVFSRKGVIPLSEKLRGIPVLDLQHLRADGQQPGGQVAEWLERWNRLSGRVPISVEQLKERNLLEIARTPILLFMAALTWEEGRTDGEPVTRAEIYERFFRQIATGKCQQDEDEHKPVAKASGKLLEQLVELRDIEKPRPNVSEREERARAMLWMLARVAWEGQRCAERRDDLTLHEVTSILKDELKIRNEPSALEMIKIGVLLVLQADQQGGNDRILFGHKSFREFLVARYWSDRLKRIVLARKEKRRTQIVDKIEKQLLDARLLGNDDESLVFLVQIVNGPGWDDEARAELIEWASETFNKEEPDFVDQDAPSWINDRRPVLREAALAVGSSTKGCSGIVADSPLTLRTMLGAFWIRGVSAQIVAPRIAAIAADLVGASLYQAHLEGANLERARLGGAILVEAHLEGASLVGANLDQAHLEGANLERAHLDSASLIGAHLVGANLVGAHLNQAQLVGAILYQANLASARLVGAMLYRANLEGANLVGANLVGANLEGASLVGANLRGANLEGARMVNAIYSARTSWPDGFEPRTAGAKRLKQARRSVRYSY